MAAQLRPSSWKASMLTTQPFPTAAEFPSDDTALAQVAAMQAAVTEVRRIRGEMEIARKVALTVLVGDADLCAALQHHGAALEHLTNVTVEPLVERPRGVATAVVHGHELVIPLAGVIDIADEIKRLDKVLAKVDKDIAAIILTAYPSLESATDAINLDVSAYMQKPFSGEDMRETIARVARKTVCACDIRRQNAAECFCCVTGNVRIEHAVQDFAGVSQHKLFTVELKLVGIAASAQRTELALRIVEGLFVDIGVEPDAVIVIRCVGEAPACRPDCAFYWGRATT